MRTVKKIKKYADSKMDKFKDDEFLNFVTDTHFTKPQKQKIKWKVVASFAVCFVLVFAVVLTVTLTLQNSIQHNTAQYVDRASTAEELNADCIHYQFKDYGSGTITLVSDRISNQKLFYNIAISLNDGTDSITLTCIIDAQYAFSFKTYELYKQYGNYKINYRVSSEYDSSKQAYTHIVDANILTDDERIYIHYIGSSASAETAFFDVLSKILTIKQN